MVLYYCYRKQSKKETKRVKVKGNTSSSEAYPGYTEVEFQQTNKGHSTLVVLPERIDSPQSPKGQDMYAKVHKLREPVPEANKRPGPLISKDGLLRRQQANVSIPMVDNNMYAANNQHSDSETRSPRRQRPHYGW